MEIRDPNRSILTSSIPDEMHIKDANNLRKKYLVSKVGLRASNLTNPYKGSQKKHMNMNSSNLTTLPEVA